MSQPTIRCRTGAQQRATFVGLRLVTLILSFARVIGSKIRCLIPAVFWRTTIGLVVCLLPLGLLFDLRSTFYVDWFNHLWTIDYYGEYFRQHHLLPDVLITNTVVGVPVPLFYSGKFYGLIGVISSVAGSAVAFRLVALLALLIQFWHVERAIRSVSGGYLLPFAIATMVTWGIYSLTNLYNRSALTEFVAVAFLTAAVSCVFVLVVRLASGQQSYYDAVSAGLFYSVAAVTHPLTALFGAVFIGVTTVVAMVTIRRIWFLEVGFFSTLLIGVVLGPWLYVCSRFLGSVPISDPKINRTWFRADFFFPESIDNFLSRVSPVPINWRAIDPMSVETPYLDAQISVPLVVAAIALTWFWRNSRRVKDRKYELPLLAILGSSFALFWLFLFVSIQPAISGVFGGFFDILQFPYRLTTYINLAAFAVVLALAGLTDWEQLTTRKLAYLKMVALFACVALSLCGLSLKLIHADAIRSVDPLANRRDLTKKTGLPQPQDSPTQWQPGILGPARGVSELPATYYGHFSYSVVDGLAATRPAGFEANQSAKFLSTEPTGIGNVHPIEIDLTKPTLVTTNVQPFPWNVLFVDGVKVQRRNIIAMSVAGYPRWMGASLQAVPVSAGRHVLEYRFIPDKAWSILNAVSWVVLIGWVIIWLVIAASPKRLTRGSRAVTP
jgi:hypothetical protein